MYMYNTHVQYNPYYVHVYNKYNYDDNHLMWLSGIYTLLG